MKLYSLLFSLLFSTLVFAQVGVGTTTPGAQLDVETEATTTSERIGLQVDVNNTSTASTNSTYSLYLNNLSTPAIGGVAEKFGIYNNVSDAGTADRYGIYTEVFKSAGATTTDMYGVYAELGLSEGATSNSYGLYANISNVGNTANIYGVYSIVDGAVANDNVYSGYYLGGKFSIGQTASDNYILPESRGTDGQVMETDATGTVTWVDKNDNSSLSLVRVNRSGNESFTASFGTWQKISFDAEVFDTNGEFEAVPNNRFTADEAGYYRISAGFHTLAQSNTNYYGIAIFVNGSIYQEETYNHHGTGDVVRSVDCLVNLAANGYVEVYVRTDSSTIVVDGFSGKTYFEVEQIRRN